MEVKKWYQSKVVLFNGLTILVVVATFFGYTPNEQLAEQTSNVLIAIAPIVNLALRFVTKSAVGK
jgi:hypothetical protein